jgi:hypothetical protein
VIKVVGRVPVFILGATINIVVIIVMFSWQPTLNSQIGELYMIKVVGLVPVFIPGATINIVVIIVMFSWQPTLNSQIGESPVIR